MRTLQEGKQGIIECAYVSKQIGVFPLLSNHCYWGCRVSERKPLGILK
ncbi:hypothetical protein [Sodalis sp.]